MPHSGSISAMKQYRKILDEGEHLLITHAWGQSPTTLYNLAIKALRQNAVPVYILSRKNFGLKSVVIFFRNHGLSVTIVGKDVGEVRMLLIQCEDRDRLMEVETQRAVEFDFGANHYKANVGDAVFSKTGLDNGSRLLLETFLSQERDSIARKVTIGDLGSGWGAISLILRSECPNARIIAIENEPGALSAARANLEHCENVDLVAADLTKSNEQALQHMAGSLDYVVSNFSFHISEQERDNFFCNVASLLKSTGAIYCVAEGRFRSQFRKSASAYLRPVQVIEKERYQVISSVLI